LRFIVIHHERLVALRGKSLSSSNGFDGHRKKHIREEPDSPQIGKIADPRAAACF
jgi:hypothetical protein